MLSNDEHRQPAGSGPLNGPHICSAMLSINSPNLPQGKQRRVDRVRRCSSITGKAANWGGSSKAPASDNREREGPLGYSVRVSSPLDQDFLHLGPSELELRNEGCCLCGVVPRNVHVFLGQSSHDAVLRTIVGLLNDLGPKLLPRSLRPLVYGLCGLDCQLRFVQVSLGLLLCDVRSSSMSLGLCQDRKWAAWS